MPRSSLRSKCILTDLNSTWRDQNQLPFEHTKKSVPLDLQDASLSLLQLKHLSQNCWHTANLLTHFQHIPYGIWSKSPNVLHPGTVLVSNFVAVMIMPLYCDRKWPGFREWERSMGLCPSGTPCIPSEVGQQDSSYAEGIQRHCSLFRSANEFSWSSDVYFTKSLHLIQ